MNLIEQLESKQAETLETVTLEDKQQWLANPVTKALLYQLEIDSYVIQNNWASGQYSTKTTEKQALGAVRAINEITEAIRGLTNND